MPRYTVKNAQGREITFDWHGDKDPTDADLEEVFAVGEPVASHEPPSVGRQLSELRDTALQSKGIQLTDAEKQRSRKMADSAMSGGLATATPHAIDQAAQQFAPGLSNALKSGARKMYGGLLKAKDATIERFPNVVDDLVKAGIPISHSGRARVVTGLRKIGGEKQTLLNAADQRAMIPRETLRGGLDDVLESTIQNSDAPVRDMGKLAKIERELIPDEPGLLPSRADRVKTQLQSQADRAFRASKIGLKTTDTGARAKMAVSHRAKEAIEAIEPGMKDVNARYASGKGQAEALRDALKRTDKHSIIGVNDLIGAGLGSAGGPAGIPVGVAAMRLATNPNIGSRIAIGGDRLARTPQLDQMTRMALLSMLAEQDQ